MSDDGARPSFESRRGLIFSPGRSQTGSNALGVGIHTKKCRLQAPIYGPFTRIRAEGQTLMLEHGKE